MDITYFTTGPLNTYDYDDPEYPRIIIEDEIAFHVASIDREFGKDDRSAANARLIVQCPVLLELARKLVIVCDERLEALQQNEESLSDFYSEEAETALARQTEYYDSLRN